MSDRQLEFSKIHESVLSAVDPKLRYHMIPDNDVQMHLRSDMCWCLPRILPDAPLVYIHNHSSRPR